MLTVEQLLQIMPTATLRADTFLDPLNAAMDEFDENTPQRQAAFLAQIAEESGELRYVRELASGGEYEGRLDLGNSELGDGIKYKGRGLIQITGRSNYEACGIALGLDLVMSPELLETPENACRSAAWFFKKHGCNELADADNFRLITIRINGAIAPRTHYDERLAYWEAAKEAIA